MNKLNKYILFLCSLGFALLVSMPVFAKSEDGTSGLIEKITQINNEIQQLNKTEVRTYRDVVKSMSGSSSRRDVSDLHRQFKDVMDDYKPNEISWGDFNPIKYHKIDKKDEGALSSLMEDMNDTKSTLSSLLSEMNKFGGEMEDEENMPMRGNSGGSSYRIYRYSYPRDYYDNGYYYRYPSRYYYDDYYYPYGYYGRPGVVGGLINSIL